MPSIVYICFFGGFEGHWLLRAPGGGGLKQDSMASVQDSLSQDRSFSWHPWGQQWKGCGSPQAKRVGLLWCIWKVLSSSRILCLAISLYSPLSKASLGKAQGNKAIHCHKIYHLLNRASVATELFTSPRDGRTRQLLAPNSTAQRPRRV